MNQSLQLGLLLKAQLTARKGHLATTSQIHFAQNLATSQALAYKAAFALACPIETLNFLPADRSPRHSSTQIAIAESAFGKTSTPQTAKTQIPKTGNQKNKSQKSDIFLASNSHHPTHHQSPPKHHNFTTKTPQKTPFSTTPMKKRPQNRAKTVRRALQIFSPKTPQLLTANINKPVHSTDRDSTGGGGGGYRRCICGCCCGGGTPAPSRFNSACDTVVTSAG